MHKRIAHRPAHLLQSTLLGASLALGLASKVDAAPQLGAASATHAPASTGASKSARRAATPIPAGLADEAVQWLQAYLRIDTTNRPGNELAACRLLAQILEREGIASQVLETSPGRGNLVATLRGSDPSKGSLILLSHSDVVPADARFWKHAPFSGDLADGCVWGRGAIDMKGMGAAQLAAFIALHRSKARLERDVVLLVVADEEMGADDGAVWMFKHHPQLFKNVLGVINEEGPGVLKDGKVGYWEVRPGQKALIWLKLTARGTPGHGSMPFPDAAPNRLLRALQRIMAWKTPVRILPQARQMFKRLAERESGARAEGLRNLDRGLRDAAFARWFFSNRTYNALVRNTISITQLEGSNKTNVIPPQATAGLDCRLLPGENLKAFVTSLRRVINDNSIELTTLDCCPPVPPSPVDTALFASIEQAIHRYHPEALVVTPYSRGANDSRYFQERGITAYGWYPFALTQDEIDTMHGNDERMPVQTFKQGIQMLFDVVCDAATQPASARR